MTILERHAKYILNPVTQIHYAIATGYKESYFPHVHDFYELLLIIQGRQLITVNGQTLILGESSLSLVRPQDVHDKKYLEKGQHINVCFSQETMQELLHYLGDGFPYQNILAPQIPPYILLSSQEKRIIQAKLESLNLLNVQDTQTIKTKLRILLFELLTKYFTRAADQHENIPPWFSAILNEMKKKENFTQGLPKLLQLSGVAHEHLCRLFKKYLQTTPTAFINEQRMNYAVNLLLHSDLDITNIALESGYTNLSHFFHMFRQKMNMTPTDYRKHFSGIIPANASDNV